jgi:hypothetical protein
MDELPGRLLVAGALVGLLAVVAWARGVLGGREAGRRAAERFAHRVGLPAAAVDGLLVARVVRRHRCVLGGVGLALVVGSLLGAGLQVGYLGLALGAAADRLTRPGPPPDALRAAHARATAVIHYVPGWLLGATGSLAAVAVAITVLWAVAPRRPGQVDPGQLTPAGAAGWLLLTAVGLVGSAVLVGLVVHRPRPVASAAELAVDDALRAQAVRDSLHLSAAGSTLAVLGLSYGLLDQTVLPPWRTVGGWTPLALLAALFLVGCWHELSGGPAYWRRRLHPELVPAAGADG